MKKSDKLKRLLRRAFSILVIAVIILIPVIRKKIFYYKICHSPFGEMVMQASQYYEPIWVLNDCYKSEEEEMLYVDFKLKDYDNSGTLQIIADTYHRIYNEVFAESSEEYKNYELEICFNIIAGSYIKLNHVTEDLKYVDLDFSVGYWNELSRYINDIPKLFPETKSLQLGRERFDDFDYIAGFESLKSFYSYYEITKEDEEKILSYYPKCQIQIGPGKRVQKATDDALLPQ